jgi:acyl-CoA thioester hydrolase
MFTKTYDALDEHIDFQGVMDGLYYPFYMEWCRHAFMKEIIGIDIEEEATKNNLYVLTEYNLKFKRSITQGAKIKVTCKILKSDKKSRFIFEQQMRIEDVVYAEARFEATCISSSGRPGIPTEVANILNKEVENNAEAI